MNIKINGKNEAINAKKNIQEILIDKGLCADRIIIEHNLRIISKEEWPQITLQENDSLEIISFVGGG